MKEFIPVCIGGIFALLAGRIYLHRSAKTNPGNGGETEQHKYMAEEFDQNAENLGNQESNQSGPGPDSEGAEKQPGQDQTEGSGGEDKPGPEGAEGAPGATTPPPPPPPPPPPATPGEDKPEKPAEDPAKLEEWEQPKIGEMVFFSPKEDDRAARANNNDGPIAAIVVRIWSNGVVNLRAFNDAQDFPLWRGSVPFNRNGGEYTWSYYIPA